MLFSIISVSYFESSNLSLPGICCL